MTFKPLSLAGKAKQWGMIAAAMIWAGGAMPVLAQVQNVDPNVAIDADLEPAGGTPYQPLPTEPVGTGEGVTSSSTTMDTATPGAPYPADPATGGVSTAAQPGSSGVYAASGVPEPSDTYQEDDLVGAAEGVFGKGAEGLASLIEKVLKDQGRPNAYIAGREAGGAIIFGLRYGSGTLSHKIEGERKIYWTGPSIGFDVGGNASKTFVLVYNLYDTQDIYRRYPAVEGTAYVVGGFTATYLRRGDIVLIPIRMGVGWRLGVNAGYMKFSEKGKIIPF